MNEKMLSKGKSWNESATHSDPLTGRTVRRITTTGSLNYKAPYHTRTCFTDDGEFLVFSTSRDGQSALCRTHVPTGEITVLTDPVDCPEVPGSLPSLGINAGTIAARSGWVVYWNKGLRAVHIHTLEERLLTPTPEAGGQPSVDPTETEVIFPSRFSVPVRPDGPTRPDGTPLFTRWYRTPLAGGLAREFYYDEGVNTNHCEHNPTDPDLLLIDRDLPPMFHSGGDMSKSARAHVMHLPTCKFTPLMPRTEAKFQIHSVWSWDGRFVLYHGPAVLIEGPCPWHIGAVRPDGTIYREWVFEQGRHYGHVTAAADRPAIILDGNMSPDKLMWLYYDADEPRFELICEHKTEWKSLPGQLTHPHPSADRLGRWIAFNVARGGRSDVWVVEN